MYEHALDLAIVAGCVLLALALTPLSLYQMLSNVNVYHKLVQNYPRVIGYRGDMPDGFSRERFQHRLQLYAETEKYDWEPEAPLNFTPEVTVDFTTLHDDDSDGSQDENAIQITYNGEYFVKKLFRFWGLSAVINVMGTFLVGVYFFAQPDLPIDSDRTDLSGNVTEQTLQLGSSFPSDPFWYILSAIIVLTVLQFVNRVIAYSEYLTSSENSVIELSREMQEELSESLYNFQFSFYLSIFVLSILIILVRTAAEGVKTFSSPPPYLVLQTALGIILASGVAALVSEAILRNRVTNRHVEDDCIRFTDTLQYDDE